ncbi:MAG: hypothetical protein L6R40_006425 [Gallowayella cf. fulva]|nr:MAG: hypothetical protein L6R40_006425 [Xanthomendoza cf. fulva]
MSHQGQSEKELMQEVMTRRVNHRQNPTRSTQLEIDAAMAKLQTFKAERDRQGPKIVERDRQEVNKVEQDRQEVNRAKRRRESHLDNIESTVRRKGLVPSTSSRPSKRELMVAKAQGEYNEARRAAANARAGATSAKQRIDTRPSFGPRSARETDDLWRRYGLALADAERKEQTASEASTKLDKAQKYRDEGRIKTERRRHEAQAATRDNQADEKQAAANKDALDQPALKKVKQESPVSEPGTGQHVLEAATVDINRQF